MADVQIDHIKVPASNLVRKLPEDLAPCCNDSKYRVLGNTAIRCRRQVVNQPQLIANLDNSFETTFR